MTDLPLVLHLNVSATWRGGEAQTMLLADLLARTNRWNSVLVAQLGAKLAKAARERGVTVRECPFKGAAGLRGLLAVRRMVRQERPTILHAHTGRAHTLAVLAAFGMRPRPLVIATRRVDFHRNDGLFSRLKYLNGTDFFIAISEKVREILQADGVPPDRIALVHSGIDLTKFSASIGQRDAVRKELGVPPDGVLLGNVAALVPHKGHTDLLRAMRTVADRHPGITLALVGDGLLDRKLREQCAHLGLAGNVRFLGFRSDIGRLLSGFDVFVMSSRTEALGTSVLDAMVMGLPVVSTSAGGIPEMIEPGVNGLLSPPCDADGLARNILTLIDDPAKRESMGAAGRETVKRFDVRVTAEKVEDVYNGLLGLRSGKGCIGR